MLATTLRGVSGVAAIEIGDELAIGIGSESSDILVDLIP